MAADDDRGAALARKGFATTDAELPLPSMDVEEVPDDEAEDYPPTEAAPTILAPPTELAWSSEPATYPRRRWSTTHVLAGAGVGALVLLAGAVAFAGVSLRPHAPTSVVTMTAAPPATYAPPPPVTYTRTATATAAPPPPSTVTVAVPQPTWTPTWTPEAPSSDDRYIAYLRSRNLTIYNRAQAIHSAHIICSELASGKSETDVMLEIRAKVGDDLTPIGLVDTVKAAEMFYCPGDGD